MAKQAAEVEATRRERATRRYAMEPVKVALKREGRPQTWLMRQLRDRAGIHVSQSTLYNYLSGYARTTRAFVRAACLVAGANPGDVYARIAGHETVLFQPEKE